MPLQLGDGLLEREGDLEEDDLEMRVLLESEFEVLRRRSGNLLDHRLK